MNNQIIGLFCRISSLSQGSFAKETYNAIDPTDRSHPIIKCNTQSMYKKPDGEWVVEALEEDVGVCLEELQLQVCCSVCCSVHSRVSYSVCCRCVAVRVAVCFVVRVAVFVAVCVATDGGIGGGCWCVS